MTARSRPCLAEAGSETKVGPMLNIEPDQDRVLAEAEIVDRAARQAT